MNRLDSRYFFLVWLLNPFFGAIMLFKNFKLNKNIFPYLILSFFFGISFVVSTHGGDSERYAAALDKYHKNGFTLYQVIETFYDEEGAQLDIYQQTVTWLVSNFTGNPKPLFAIFAIVFGFFWFKSLIIVRENVIVPMKGLIAITFLFLVLLNPIWNINGVRMWTAIGSFFYGFLLIHVENKKKGWFFILLSIFIHFSLILSVALYFLVRLIPAKNINVLFFLYLISFFLGELDLGFVRGIFELVPNFFQSKRGYVSDEYIEVISENQDKFNLFVVLARSTLKYIILTICSLIFYYIKIKKIKHNDLTFKFFVLALPFLVFSNLASSVPSGIRFAVLSNLIAASTFLFFFNYKIKINIFIKSALILSILLVNIFSIRIGIESIGIFLFIGNPILNLFIVDVPIIELLKSFIS